MILYKTQLSISVLYMMRLFVVLVLLTMTLACAPATDRQEIRLGTAALGGAYYPLGVIQLGNAAFRWCFYGSNRD